jgi:hypothetical protein
MLKSAPCLRALVCSFFIFLLLFRISLHHVANTDIKTGIKTQPSGEPEQSAWFQYESQKMNRMRFSEELRSMDDHNFWPSPDSFLDFVSANLISDGRARFISIAVCDAESRPTVKFYQKQYAHFYFEFEVLENIEVASGGLEFRDAAGYIVRGRNTLQYGSPVPTSVRS